MERKFVFSISLMLSIFFLAGCSSFIQDIKTISEPHTFTVTFNPNSNDESSVHGTMDPQLFTKDEPQLLSQNRYTRDNYAYLGWADEPSATEVLYKDEELFTAVEDTTLYAVWGEPNYKIIYQFQNLDGISYDDQTLLCYGEPGTKTSVTASEVEGFTLENFDQIEIDQDPATVQEIRITYNRNKYTISFL
ncbi:MAG: InlB B-repeat-containing protein, partial [Treponema sp.]|uniref:InlB B-repeat-containing protein n=1 Tax=Treponema sp. TaxID=166 RepID=UPI00298E8F24